VSGKLAGWFHTNEGTSFEGSGLAPEEGGHGGIVACQSVHCRGGVSGSHLCPYLKNSNDEGVHCPSSGGVW